MEVGFNPQPFSHWTTYLASLAANAISSFEPFQDITMCCSFFNLLEEMHLVYIKKIPLQCITWTHFDAHRVDILGGNKEKNKLILLLKHRHHFLLQTIFQVSVKLDTFYSTLDIIAQCASVLWLKITGGSKHA